MDFYFRRLSSADERALAFAETLYIGAFPPDERRDFSAMLSLAERSPHFHFTLFYEDAEPVGILSYWSWRHLRYIEHFAVAPDCRGSGIGSQVLERFCRSAATPVVLEAELPTDEVSRRRIAIYRRAGFTAAPQRYVQPPYGVGKMPVELLLLSWGDVDWAHDFEAVRDLLHTEVYGVEAGRYR